jgi:hypothetical protein
MTRFLSANTLDELLSELSDFGFVWKDANGDTVQPTTFDVSTHNGAACVYIGQIANEYDEEGNLTKEGSTKYHANVIGTDYPFTTEQPAPETPYNVFAE